MNQVDDLEARRQRWMRSRRMWYNIYLFVGVGINFILYFTKPFGFDPSHSILWGSFFGLCIPLLTMVVCGFLHQKVLGL